MTTDQMPACGAKQRYNWVEPKHATHLAREEPKQLREHICVLPANHVEDHQCVCMDTWTTKAFHREQEKRLLHQRIKSLEGHLANANHDRDVAEGMIKDLTQLCDQQEVAGYSSLAIPLIRKTIRKGYE